MSADRILRLDLVGFVWNPTESQWENSFAELQSYKVAKGDCNVPDRFPENPALGTWVRWQRFHRRDLTSERIARLEQVGFNWDPLDTVWAEKYSELEQYKAIHGNCNVPQVFPENKSLAGWVAGQRQANHAGRLKPERLKQLEEIGFVFDPRTAAWDAMFASLAEYRRKFGDCNIPVLYPQNPQLLKWLSVQRTFRKQQRLSKDRISRLNELGFVWDPADSAWEAMFSALSEYRERFGDCNVSIRWSENTQLARWVANLRSRRGKLTDDQANRLGKIGFIWNPFEVAWEDMFKALQQYRQTNGDCNVPADYPENQKLARWATGQRAKQSKLTKERFSRLDSIGFQWKMKSGPKPRRTQ